MASLNETPTPGGNRPVFASNPEVNNSAIIADVTTDEAIPDWLLDFARTPEPKVVQLKPEYAQQTSLPEALLSVQERSFDSQYDDDYESIETDNATEPQIDVHLMSIWEDEDAIQLGPAGPNQTFSDPIDELKVRLDEDPQETVEFIRAHMQDEEFRAEAILILRAYLPLDPKNDVLKQVFEELQQKTNPHKEA